MVLPFYTELKNLRQEQEIDLSEVANRTKINSKYLEALESGDFSFLPTVYVRLFLRAYALEIGSDPQDTLKQLDIHLAKTEELPEPQQTAVEESRGEEEEEEYGVSQKTPLRFRSDIFKVAVLLAIALFAIFIIRGIVSEESPAMPAEVTDELLADRYTSRESTQKLVIEAPYRFTLKGLHPVWCSYSIDEAESRSETLAEDEEMTWVFKSGFRLRVNQSRSVEVSINGHHVAIDPSPHPVELTYLSGTGELTVTTYLLK